MSLTSRRNGMLRSISSSRCPICFSFQLIRSRWISIASILEAVEPGEFADGHFRHQASRARSLVHAESNRHSANHDFLWRNREQRTEQCMIFRESFLRAGLQTPRGGGDHHVLNEHSEIEPA